MRKSTSFGTWNIAINRIRGNPGRWSLELLLCPRSHAVSRMVSRTLSFNSAVAHTNQRQQLVTRLRRGAVWCEPRGYATDILGTVVALEPSWSLPEKRNRLGCPAVDVGKRLCRYWSAEGTSGETVEQHSTALHQRYTRVQYGPAWCLPQFKASRSKYWVESPGGDHRDFNDCNDCVCRGSVRGEKGTGSESRSK